MPTIIVSKQNFNWGIVASPICQILVRIFGRLARENTENLQEHTIALGIKQIWGQNRVQHPQKRYTHPFVSPQHLSTASDMILKPRVQLCSMNGSQVGHNCSPGWYRSMYWPEKKRGYCSIKIYVYWLGIQLGLVWDWVYLSVQLKRWYLNHFWGCIERLCMSPFVDIDVELLQTYNLMFSSILHVNQTCLTRETRLMKPGRVLVSRALNKRPNATRPLSPSLWGLHYSNK